MSIVEAGAPGSLSDRMGQSIHRHERDQRALRERRAAAFWLCRKAGGDIEQFKFLLRHASIQTTERYLGSQQDIEIAVNDNLGL